MNGEAVQYCLVAWCFWAFCTNTKQSKRGRLVGGAAGVREIWAAEATRRRDEELDIPCATIATWMRRGKPDVGWLKESAETAAKLRERLMSACCSQGGAGVASFANPGTWADPATQPNEMWHIDASLLRSPDGRQLHMHAVMDSNLRRGNTAATSLKPFFRFTQASGLWGGSPRKWHPAGPGGRQSGRHLALPRREISVCPPQRGRPELWRRSRPR